MVTGTLAPTVSRRSIWQRILGKDWKLGWILVLPILVVLVGLIAYPFILAIILSFTDKMIGRPATFVGLENYRDVLFGAEFGSVFWKSVVNTVLYTGVAVTCKAFLGMGMALFLHEEFRGHHRGLLARLALQSARPIGLLRFRPLMTHHSSLCTGGR